MSARDGGRRGRVRRALAVRRGVPRDGGRRGRVRRALAGRSGGCVVGASTVALRRRAADILAQLQKQAQRGESGVAAAFELNWQSLEPEAQKLACLLSLFALAPIPWSLVESAASSSDLEFDLKVHCTVLVERYLLQELAEDTYQVHERIRELLRQKLEELAEVNELKHGFCQAIVPVARNIPEKPTLIDIAKVTLAIPHLGESATVDQDWLSDDDLISPFEGLVRFYAGQGAYDQALSWGEQSLSATQRASTENHT